MNAPKYLEKMKDLTEKGLFVLNGNRLLIELLEETEKVTKSGIITGVVQDRSLAALDKARAAVVLAVGAGYTIDKEDGSGTEDVDLPYKVGDIVLVNQFAVKTFGQFFELANYKENSIGLVTDDLVQGAIKNLEAFNDVLRR